MSQPPEPESDASPANTSGKWSVFQAIIVGVFLGAIGIGLAALVFGYASLDVSWRYWGEHSINEDGTRGVTKFDRSTIFRNFGLAALALIGLGLATWRSYLALQQTKTGLKQAETAERGLIIDRYQKGAVMLESEELSVRIAGVFALRELALSDPDETYFLVLDVLYAFVREKSKTRQRRDSPAQPYYAKQTKTTEFATFDADIGHALEAATHLRDTVNAAKVREQQNKWLADVRHANLSGADLGQANLSGAELWHANLSGADLGVANLSGANLGLANLSGANLSEANLSGANLREANLSGAKLREANLSGAKLREANLSGAYLWQANLSGAYLWQANLSGAYLWQANLSGAILGNANLSDAKLKEANLSDARLIGANLSGAELRQANLSDAKLKEANLSGAKLMYANLSGADLVKVKVSEGTVFNRIFTYEDNPPRIAPQMVLDAILMRKQGESVVDFWRRIDSEQKEKTES